MRMTWGMMVIGMMSMVSSASRAETETLTVEATNGRSFDEAEAIYRTMPPVQFRPPADRWEKLPRTRQILSEGGKSLRVVMLGDQRIAELTRSGWANMVHERHPLTQVDCILCVRPDSGCWWFKDDDRVKQYVAIHNPDLLIIGGNGHHNDIASIAEVIRQVRENVPCDILLLTEAFNGLDPWGYGQWTFDIPDNAQSYRARLRDLAQETHCAFLDLTAHVGKYIRDVAAVKDIFREKTRSMDYFMRDDKRSSNPRGEQIIGRIVAAYLTGAVVPEDEGVGLFSGAYSRGERPAEEFARVYREMPPVKFTPPPGRWECLPRSAAILGGAGRPWRVVMLGDSIIADTSHSCWDRLVQLNYPRHKVNMLTVVRGSTGCWWYREAGRINRYVLGFEPDILIIGGISQKDDIDAIAEVIRQVRDKSECDILLMTGPFGKVDPHDDAQWTFDIPKDGNNYRRRLQRLAGEMSCGFLDMTAHWGKYIRDSGLEVDYFKRDAIHANSRGEQILGRILARRFLQTPHNSSGE